MDQTSGSVAQCSSSPGNEMILYFPVQLVEKLGDWKEGGPKHPLPPLYLRPCFYLWCYSCEKRYQVLSTFMIAIFSFALSSEALEQVPTSPFERLIRCFIHWRSFTRLQYMYETRHACRWTCIELSFITDTKLHYHRRKHMLSLRH